MNNNRITHMELTAIVVKKIGSISNKICICNITDNEVWQRSVFPILTNTNVM